jgi:hypothetical protein
VTDALNTQEAADRIEQMMDAGNANPEPEQEPSDEIESEAEVVDEEISEEAESDEDIEDVEATDEQEEVDEEVWMPESLQELAEAMEVDEDAIKAIRVKTKIDGIEGEATLADVIKSYQLDKSLTNKSEAIAQQRREFEATSQQQLATLGQRLQEVEAVSQALEAQIEQQVGMVDWNQLREDDPGMYAAKRQEFIEQLGAIQQHKQKAIETAQQQQYDIQQQSEVQRQEFLVQQHNMLVEAIPEWRDQSAMQQGMQEVKEFTASKLGITEAEFNSIMDHRFFLGMRDAMLYHKLKDKAEPAKKKVKSKPKFVKPGARQSKQAVNQRKTDNLKAKLRKSGSVQDAAALLLDRI